MTTPSPTWNKERAIPWLVLAVVLIVIGAFAAYTQLAEYQRIAETEQERVNTQARIVEENLVQQLKGVTRALDGIRSEMPFWQQDNHWHLASQHLTAMSDAIPGVRTFVITDVNGTITAANRAQLIGQNFRYRDYFRIPHDQPDAQTLYVSPPFKTVFGVSAINVSRAILSAEGQFDGVVSATLSPEYFTILLNSILYAPDVKVLFSHGSDKLFLELPRADKTTPHLQSGSKSKNCLLYYLFPNHRCQIGISRTIQPPAMAMNEPLVVTVRRDMSATDREWQLDSLSTIVILPFLPAPWQPDSFCFSAASRCSS
jgi:hypothetical protein